MLLNRFHMLQKVNESINMFKRVFQFFLVLSGIFRDEKIKWDKKYSLLVYQKIWFCRRKGNELEDSSDTTQYERWAEKEQNISELCFNFRQTNVCVIAPEERTWTESIFEEIMTQVFPNLMTTMNPIN